jgi:hypothetical protein
MFGKLVKINNWPIGEKTSDLVTLFAGFERVSEFGLWSRVARFFLVHDTKT